MAFLTRENYKQMENYHFEGFIMGMRLSHRHAGKLHSDLYLSLFNAGKGFPQLK